jgi:hypothetical protein
VSDKLKCFLQECMKELAARARLAKTERDLTKSETAMGRSFAYYDVISYLQGQANGFLIPLEDIGLNGIDPDQELIWA